MRQHGSARILSSLRSGSAWSPLPWQSTAGHTSHHRAPLGTWTLTVLVFRSSLWVFTYMQSLQQLWCKAGSDSGSSQKCKSCQMACSHWGDAPKTCSMSGGPLGHVHSPCNDSGTGYNSRVLQVWIGYRMIAEARYSWYSTQGGELGK